MTKQEAFDLFGGQSKLVSALECSRQMPYQWGNELTLAQSDRVIGAALRIGIKESPEALSMEISRNLDK